MTIASVGACGTGASSTAGTTLSHTTATNALAAGDFLLLFVATDNVATVDGASNNHTSVTGGTGTWTKLGEYTNTVGGAAGDGVTESLWLFIASGAVATGTVFTINMSSCTDKASLAWKFTKASGASLRLSTAITGNVTDASAGFGSVTISGLDATITRLYARALGKEANIGTTGFTASTNFTSAGQNRSRNDANAVGTCGEFRINASSGETSNPTLAVTGDTAALFAAIEEYYPLTMQDAASASTTDNVTLTVPVLGINNAISAPKASTPTLSGSGAPVTPVYQFVGPLGIFQTRNTNRQAVGPTGVFYMDKPPPAASGGSTILVVANAVSASVSDNVTLTGRYALTLANAASASVADNVTLSPKTALVIGPANSASVTDNVTLTYKGALIVADAIALSVSDNIALASKYVLNPADAISASVATSPTLAPKTTLVVATANGLSVADNLILTGRYALTVQDAVSATVTDNVVLTPRYSLTVANALSASVADNVTLSTSGSLGVQAAVAATTTTSPSLVQHNVLSVQNAITGIATDNVVVTPRTSLTVQPASSTSVLDSLNISPKWALTVQAATSLTTASSPLLAPKTTLSVDPATALSTASAPVLTTHAFLVVDYAISPSIVDQIFFSVAPPTQYRIVVLGKVELAVVSLTGGSGDRVASLMSSGVEGRTASLYSA